MEDRAEHFFNAGLNFIKLGRYAEAVASFDKAIAIEPDDADLWYFHGDAISRLNRHAEAVASYDKAIAIKPNDADLWYFRGGELGELGQHAEAVASYDKAIAIKPGDIVVWKSRGGELFELGRHAEAIASYDKVIAIKPDDASAWHFRGYSLDGLGQHEEALVSYNKAIAINPNDAKSWFFRGHTLSRLGRHTDAVASFDKAIAINPNDASAWYFRGSALSSLGRHEEALLSCDKAIAINPNDGDIYFLKGTILDDLDLQEEAFEAFNRATELDPNDETSKDFKNDTLDVLEPKFEPIFTKLTQMGTLNYIQNFCQKFPNCKKGTPDFSKLHQLLEKKGCTLSPEKLNIIIEIVSRQQASKKFKEKMLHNNPKTSEDLIRNFLEVYGENYNQFIDDILKVLIEDFSYGDRDIQIDISRIQKEIELNNFESCLISDSHSGERLTINDVDKISGYEFEILLKRLFESMGYSVTHTNLSNDQGADLIIEKFGERTVVQAKNWQNNVDNSGIQQIVAAVRYYDAQKSMVISSSGFTNSAIELAQSNKVELMDREKLSKILKENPIFKK